MYSGRIAVPLFDPGEPGHIGRLHAVLDDCTPSAILTTTDSAEGVRSLQHPRGQRTPARHRVDTVPDEVAGTWVQPEQPQARRSLPAVHLGSTRKPAGVKITHRAVATNMVQVLTALDAQEGHRGVSWLPFFHDMGLITMTLPSIIGRAVVVHDPAVFVRRPIRWLRELGVKGDDRGPAISAAPNFAFEHAALRGLPKEGAELDLSNVRAILNGSEPVSKAFMRKFADAFAPYGLSPNVVKPSYGMAEATLFVSST